MQSEFFCNLFRIFKFYCTFAPHLSNAQMAELADALVSNTSGVKPIPVRSRFWAHKKREKDAASSLLFFCHYDSLLWQPNSLRVVAFAVLPRITGGFGCGKTGCDGGNFIYCALGGCHNDGLQQAKGYQEGSSHVRWYGNDLSLWDR